jgi:pilus assembly protein CpaC
MEVTMPNADYPIAKAMGKWRKRGMVCLLPTACCLLFAGVMIAGDPTPPSSSDPGTKKDQDNSPPHYLPMYLPSAKDAAPPPLPTVPTKAPASVLLPPIKNVGASHEEPPPRIKTPQQSKSENAPTAFLEPPPTVSVAPKTTPAETMLEVVVGQPHLLTFPEVPLRVALAVNEKDPLASLQEVPHRPREWYLIGKKTGTTFLDVWLPDSTSATSHKVMHYHVRIVTQRIVKQEKPVERPQPLEPIYETLEGEINRTFPGSSVRLKRVGETLVVSGTARNIFEATRILTIAREYAPGTRSEVGRNSAEPKLLASPSLQAILDNYAHVGGPHVVNLLRIPGEQQIMLRFVVAEVNQAAARNLGLDFGLGERQATVLPNRPAAADGSSTVHGNGWVGQILRTLQEHNLAQTLAEPTLTTLNGQATRFQAGGEFPIPVVSASPTGAVQGVAFRSYGVQLSVQPILADAERIRLTVEAEVSGTDPKAAAQVGGTSVPGLKMRNFQSTVELREGETLAVAGLVRGATGSALPQGVTPAYANNAPTTQELIVLISPLLLHTAASAPTTNNPFNPQNVELYLRSRNTPLPKGDALFLIGPQGYAGEAQQGSSLRR